MTEDDLRTIVREFRASVSADLAEQHRRMDAFADEMRDHVRLVGDRIELLSQRVGTSEVGIINEIRAVANRFDARMERIEHRLDER
jgi:hypothetical protein